MAVSVRYEASIGGYKGGVRGHFHVGDVIQKAREERHWNQERLGREAANYAPDGKRLSKPAKKINKSTVSVVESSPYRSKLGTIVRLLAALGISFRDAIYKTEGSPPLEHRPEGARRAG